MALLDWRAAGGDLYLAAVHEKMGEQTMTVTVKPQGTAKADFSFSAK